MNIIVFVLIGLALFGSIYWLRPSPKEKRLSELRLKAIQSGLQVKLRKFEPDSKETGIRDSINAAHYTMFVPAEKSSQLRWCVVKQAGWEQQDLPQGWSWHNKNSKLNQNALNELINECQHDVQVLAAYDNHLVLVSNETKEVSAELIKGWLERIKNI